MKVEYFKEYSNCLNREMEFKIYGHTGIPLLVFPAQDGRFYDFENFGMVSVIADKIEAGSIQVFCLDSIDGECWSDCYELNVAGVTRQLPIIPSSPELAIASFVILGDCALVTAAAPLLVQKLPKVDYLVTAEAKGIPLVHEVSRLLGLPYYIVARKSVKP